MDRVGQSWTEFFEQLCPTIYRCILLIWTELHSFFIYNFYTQYRTLGQYVWNHEHSHSGAYIQKNSENSETLSKPTFTGGRDWTEFGQKLCPRTEKLCPNVKRNY